MTLNKNDVKLPAGILFGLVLALALSSSAEDTELDSGPRAVPYNGILEYNGQPLNGQADLHFTLTDVPGGQGASCIFTEEHDNIVAYSGRFSVNIGSITGDLPDCVFDSNAIYIEIGVRDAMANEDADDTNDEYVTLAGSQRIHPVPFSYWSAEGSDFKIDGSATVGGPMEVGGAMAVGGDMEVRGAQLRLTRDNSQLLFSQSLDPDNTINAFSDYKLMLFQGSNATETYGFGIQSSTLFANSNAEYDFKVDGVDRLNLTATNATFNTNLAVTGTSTINGLNFEYETWGSGGVGDGGAAIRNSNSGYNGLMVVGNNSGGGGVRRVGLWDDVDINRNLILNNGSISDSNSSVNINDGLSVTGGLSVGNNIFAGGDLLNIEANGNRTFQLPRYSSPPFACTSDRQGAMYFDTSSGGSGNGNSQNQVPCICIRTNGNSFWDVFTRNGNSVGNTCG